MTTSSPDTRSILAVTGQQRYDFLQGLVSNQVPAAPGQLIYAALLSPQGKYLVDFFLFADETTIYIDVHADHAAALAQRLNMYKLRTDVTIAQSDLSTTLGLDTPPPHALTDPRHPALGWRLYATSPAAPSPIEWDAIRVAHCIPQTGIELIPNDTYILEAGFERLNGVDFKKGCYVGQEVTARMKHKTELRKGFETVAISGAAPIGSDILSAGKSVGTLFTQSGDRAIAYLRFDRAVGEMQAETARITRL